MENTNTLAAIIVAMMMIILAVFTSLILNLSLVENLITGWVLTTAYSIFALFIMGDTVIFPMRTEIKEVETPIYVDRPIYIETPVIREVEVETPGRTIYVEKPRKKLNIPKYNYVASTEAKTYHKKTCRLSKLIKKKFKLNSYSKNFFIKKRYRPCKICMKK